jgi:D-xylose 1-dehydrogenase (NADP+, D-xylono-1,5-lactone-forming)
MAAIEPVRWGIVSTARINRLVIPGLQTSPETELLAVASRDESRAKQYAEQHGIPRAYGSYEALLADPDIEAVYISLPNSMHVEWSIRSLEAGKHVLCEKPFARDPAEVERAYDVATANERLLMEAFMWRFHPQTLQLQLLVDNLSPIERIDSKFGFTVKDPTDARLSRKLGGGALMDVGCYCVSAARLLAGEPERVIGRQKIGGDGVDVHFEGELVFANDLRATFECGLDMEEVDELRVDGEAGSVFLDDPWHGREPVIVLMTPLETREIREPTIDPYQAEVENLSRAARGLDLPLLGRDDALGQARTIDALYRSAEAGGAEVSIAA